MIVSSRVHPQRPAQRVGSVHGKQLLALIAVYHHLGLLSCALHQCGASAADFALVTVAEGTLLPLLSSQPA